MYLNWKKWCSVGERRNLETRSIKEGNRQRMLSSVFRKGERCTQTAELSEEKTLEDTGFK
jgi:hypothetical protein